MSKILIKVRNQDTFLMHIIPEYVKSSFHFNFTDYVDEIICQNKLPLDNTIVYEFNSDETISCLGIDDGYEREHNSVIEERLKHGKEEK